MKWRFTLSLLSLDTRLSALLQHSEEDLKQGQQHLGLGTSCSCSVSAGLGFLESPLDLVSAPRLLALALGLDAFLLACIAYMHVTNPLPHVLMFHLSY